MIQIIGRNRFAETDLACHCGWENELYNYKILYIGFLRKRKANAFLFFYILGGRNMEDKIKKLYKGIVKSVKCVATDLFEIQIKAEGFAAKAGQFISILCDNCTLRRPFSIMNADEGIITILFKLKGKGF